MRGAKKDQKLDPSKIHPEAPTFLVLPPSNMSSNQPPNFLPSHLILNDLQTFPDLLAEL